MAGRLKKFAENTLIMPEVMDSNTRWILSQVHHSGDWPVSPALRQSGRGVSMRAPTTTERYWLFGLLHQATMCRWQFGSLTVHVYIHTYFISNTAVTRTTLCWEDSKATTALTAALKKKQLLKNKH